VIERRIPVDGLTTRLLEEGRGPCIILLHGGSLGCSADDWGAMVPDLASRGFRVLAYDQPGFGASDDPPDPSLAYRRRFIAGLLDVLSIEQATIVGHSQAGRLALASALETPERVDAAVVVCTGSLLPPLVAGEREVEVPTHVPTADETRAQLEASVYHRDYVTAGLVERFQRFSVRNFESAVKRASPPAGAAASPVVRANWERLGDSSRPLELIYGANDKGSVRERVALAPDRYPQLPIHLLEECGHFAQWDQPEALLHLLADFARNHSARS